MEQLRTEADAHVIPGSVTNLIDNVPVEPPIDTTYSNVIQMTDPAMATMRETIMNNMKITCLCIEGNEHLHAYQCCQQGDYRN